MTDSGQTERLSSGSSSVARPGYDRAAAKQAIARLEPRSAAGRLRELMPEIERKVREGVRYADIVAALEEGGIKIGLETFRKYLHRYRKARSGDVRARRADGHSDSSSVRDAETQATPDSPDDMVKASPTPDDDRVRAMLDPRERDEFAEQFIESPTLRWLREKEAKDQKK